MNTNLTDFRDLEQLKYQLIQNGETLIHRTIEEINRIVASELRNLIDLIKIENENREWFEEEYLYVVLGKIIEVKEYVRKNTKLRKRIRAEREEGYR